LIKYKITVKCTYIEDIKMFLPLKSKTYLEMKVLELWKCHILHHQITDSNLYCEFKYTCTLIN